MCIQTGKIVYFDDDDDYTPCIVDKADLGSPQYNPYSSLRPQIKSP